MFSQDILNSVYAEFPDIVYTIPCVWNVQIGSKNNIPHLCIGSKPDAPKVFILRRIGGFVGTRNPGSSLDQS